MNKYDSNQTTRNEKAKHKIKLLGQRKNIQIALKHQVVETEEEKITNRTIYGIYIDGRDRLIGSIEHIDREDEYNTTRIAQHYKVVFDENDRRWITATLYNERYFAQ